MIEQVTSGMEARNHRFRMRHSAMIQRELEDAAQPTVKMAETPEEIEEALSLVYREYVRLGYISEGHGAKIYATIYHLLPQTSILLCTVQEQIIGTLTQIFDSRIFGLPSDCLYYDELQKLRKSGRKVIEISALATLSGRPKQNAFVYLFRAVYEYTKLWNVDDLCIMVNPKHVAFYKAVLLFEQLGPEKYYPRVGAPAVALRLNLDHIEERLKENYCDLGGENENWYSFLCLRARGAVAASWSVGDQILDENTVRHLFLEQTRVFEEAPPEQQNYIRAIYPGL